MTAERIRAGAIRLFAQRGYQATTVRDLAEEANVKVGSLYNHFPAKEDLLFSIMAGVMEGLADAADNAAAAQVTSTDQLRAVIETSTFFYGTRADEIFIGTSELRSLDGPRRAAIVALRDRYEQRVLAIVSRGVREGEFFVSDVRLAVYAVVAIGLHITAWYRPGGRMSLEEIASIQSDLVLRSFKCEDRHVAAGDLIAAFVGES